MSAAQPSRTRSRTGSGIPSGTSRLLKLNVEKLSDVPLEGEWTTEETNAPPGLVSRLENGAVERVRSTVNSQNSVVGIYTLTESGRKKLEEYREEREESDTMVPCHPGLVNPRGEDGYRCGDPDCDLVYSREEVNL